MSMFLSSQDISELTGRKTKSKQIEALSRMGGIPPPARTLSIGMMSLSEVLHGT
jgi:hypothetical protein